MKKIALVLLSLTMVIGLAACGESKSSSAANSKTDSFVESAVASTVDSGVASTPEDGESTPVTPVDVKLGDEVIAIGDSKIGLRVPTNFSFNDGWSCYSDTEFKTAIWLKDAQVFEDASKVDSAINNFNYEYTEEKIGNFSVKIVANPDGFYGAMTDYYVTFDAPIAGIAGCRIMVSDNQKDMIATQSDIIKEMIASICEK